MIRQRIKPKVRENLDKNKQKLVFTLDFLFSSCKILDQTPVWFQRADDYEYLTQVKRKLRGLLFPEVEAEENIFMSLLYAHNQKGVFKKADAIIKLALNVENDEV